MLIRCSALNRMTHLGMQIVMPCEARFTSGRLPCPRFMQQSHVKNA
jgi:hypothetical protein